MASHSDVDKLRALALEMDPPQDVIANVERDFRAALPSALKQAWMHVLGGGDNALGLLTGERMRVDFERITELVNREALQLQVIEPTRALPFVLLPFARSYGDEDFVALDLSKPVGNGDFLVRVCVHEIGSAGPTYPSFAAWMAFEQNVLHACDVMHGMWTDPAHAKALREHVVRAEFDEFEAIARKVLATDGRAASFDDDTITEAVERTWELADPVEIKPSLPPL